MRRVRAAIEERAAAAATALRYVDDGHAAGARAGDVHACLSGQQQQQYAKLVAELGEAHGIELAHVLDALSCCARHLGDADCDELVSVALAYDFASRPRCAAADAAFRAFALNLVSANARYMEPVLHVLVRGFTARARTAAAAAAADDDASVERDEEQDGAVEAVLHDTLHGLLNMYSAAPALLLRSLSRAFPHKSRSAAEHAAFVRAALACTRYAPSILDGVVALTVERTVQVDLEAGVPSAAAAAQGDQATAHAAHEAAAQADGSAPVFELEGMSPSTPPSPGAEQRGAGAGSVSAQTASAVDAADAAAMVLPDVDEDGMAAKLDAIMCQLFAFIEESASASSHDEQHCDGLFHALLRATERHLLTYHRTRHVQFVLLVLCGTRGGGGGGTPALPSFADALLQRFLSIYTDPSEMQSARVSAALYAGSLVASSTAVPAESALQWISVTAAWLHSYVDCAAAAAMAPAACGPRPYAMDGSQRQRQQQQQHPAFYAATAALIHTVTSRSRELMANERGRERIRALRLSRVLRSPLDPLRVCSASVGERFCSVAKERGILDVSDLMAPASPRCAKRISVGGHEPSDGELSFFPFGLYALPASYKYVARTYRVSAASCKHFEYHGELRGGAGSSERCDEAATRMQAEAVLSASATLTADGRWLGEGPFTDGLLDVGEAGFTPPTYM